MSAAACAILVCGSFRYHGRFDPILRAKQPTQLVSTPALHFLENDIALASLSSEIQVPTSYRPPRLKSGRIASRTRRVLKILPITVEPQTAEMTPLSSPSISVSTATTQSTLLLPQSPEPPKFRNRNRILRALNIVATPFRLLASRLKV